MRVGVLGAGKMGFSLVKGFLGSGVLKPRQVTVSDVDKEKLGAARVMGLGTTSDNVELVKAADVVIIAVKPKDVGAILEETRKASRGKLFVSMAAGRSTEFIESTTLARVVRVMPNICGAVGEMASCFSLGKSATRSDQKLVERLLGSVGVTFKVEEKLMDAVTGVSGSGPAYFAYIIKAMAEAGEEMGLPKKISLALAAQTAKGTGELLKYEAPDELVQKVCTPKGTTIEGMKVLEERGVAKAVKDAVKASVKRAKELSR
jgi:pyrroline-5-carboxylate reductase